MRVLARCRRRMSRASQPDQQNGTLSADTIRASGHVRPHQKAGHKTASNQNAKDIESTLAMREPSTQDVRPARSPATAEGFEPRPSVKISMRRGSVAFGQRTLSSRIPRRGNRSGRVSLTRSAVQKSGFAACGIGSSVLPKRPLLFSEQTFSIIGPCSTRR